MDIFGGEIRVFYAFHTIPCVGFEVRFGNKRFVSSSSSLFGKGLASLTLSLCFVATKKIESCTLRTHFMTQLAFWKLLKRLAFFLPHLVFFPPKKVYNSHGRFFSQGVITDLRAQALLDFPFDADLVLHECGVPPIHTPLKCLQALDDDIRSRLFLVHVTASRYVLLPLVNLS